MKEKVTPLSEREKEIKRIEYRKKASEKREEMIVPLEIRMLAGLPYAIIMLIITFTAVAAGEYPPPMSILIWLLLMFIAIMHTVIRYFFKGVGMIPYLLGMAMMDRETGYLVTRDQMWELIKREYYNRLMLTNFKHMFDFLEGPLYRTLAMKELDYVIGYRKQAQTLRYYLDTIKRELS
jgi:hypothetical protein